MAGLLIQRQDQLQVYNTGGQVPQLRASAPLYIFTDSHLHGSSGGGTQRSLHRAFSLTRPVGSEPLNRRSFSLAHAVAKRTRLSATTAILAPCHSIQASISCERIPQPRSFITLNKPFRKTEFANSGFRNGLSLVLRCSLYVGFYATCTDFLA